MLQSALKDFKHYMLSQAGFTKTAPELALLYVSALPPITRPRLHMSLHHCRVMGRSRNLESSESVGQVT